MAFNNGFSFSFKLLLKICAGEVMDGMSLFSGNEYFLFHEFIMHHDGAYVVE